MLKKIILTGAVGVLGIGVLVVSNEILFLLKQSNTTKKIQPRSSNENNTGLVEGFNPYIGKDSRGSKVYINSDDVSCKNKVYPPTKQTGTVYARISETKEIRCTANGKKVDLAGKAAVFQDWNVCAKRPGEYTKKGGAIVSLNDSPLSQHTLNTIDGNKPTNFVCIAALRYGKYDPNWVNR